MDWDRVLVEVEEMLSPRLENLYSGFHSHHEQIQELIQVVESLSQHIQTHPKGKPKLSIDIETSSNEEPKRPQTARVTSSKKPGFDKPGTADPKNKKAEEEKLKKEEAKKKSEEEKNKKAEEAKKKKEEENKKKEEAKKKTEEEKKLKAEEAKKKKDEETKKKEEAKKKADEEKEKKKQEEAEKKQKADEATKAKKAEEAQKKKLEEENKKKAGEEKKKAEEAKKKANEDKKKEEGKKKEESKKKVEESKKKGEEGKKKAEEHKKKAGEEKKMKGEEEKTKPENHEEEKHEEPEPAEEEKNEEPENAEPSSQPEENSEDKIPNVDNVSDAGGSPIEPANAEDLLIENNDQQNENAQDPASEENKESTSTEESKESSPVTKPTTATLSLEEIDKLIASLTENHSIDELTTGKQFELSVGAKSALSLLTTMDDDKFYLDRYPRSDVVWAWRIFFQLLGQTLPEDDNKAWDECRKFLIDSRNKEKNKRTVDKIFNEKVTEFDFSDENIDKLEEIIGGRESTLNPQYFTDFCALTGLLMFSVREATLFGGAIKGKIPLWRQYKRLIHKKQKIEGNTN